MTIMLRQDRGDSGAIHAIHPTTHDGQIQMVCPPQGSAAIDAHIADGHIGIQLPITSEGKIGKDFKGTIGKAEARITLRAGGGSTRIR